MKIHLCLLKSTFWKGVDLNEKVILDAGTGFGLTTSEIAGRLYQQRTRGRIISVDIDSRAFEDARRLLQTQGLLNYVTFVKADLSNMVEIASEFVDVVVSTRTLADINATPCRLTRAITEFYRVLKLNGQAILSDECPLLTAQTQEEEVAVRRWQLVKAMSHLIGRPHANETEPEDIESTMQLVGFHDVRWTVFKGEPIPQRRINYFVERAIEMTEKIKDSKLKNAFREQIENIRTMFTEQGGTFPSRYIIHAKK